MGYHFNVTNLFHDKYIRGTCIYINMIYINDEIYRLIISVKRLIQKYILGEQGFMD